MKMADEVEARSSAGQRHIISGVRAIIAGTVSASKLQPRPQTMMGCSQWACRRESHRGDGAMLFP
jgi:hypothetical protein